MLLRFLLLALPMVCTVAHADRQPNVLFIAIDDLNDWVGCVGGHPQVQTPNLDRLATRGVNFTNAHCQAPICNPSRISMLLGKLPSTTGHYFLMPGFRDVAVTENAETVFQYFRRHGYRTETIGKIFHSGADPQSFDHVEPTSGRRGLGKKLNYDVAGSHPLWDWGQIDFPDEQQRDFKTAAWAAGRLPELSQANQPFVMAVGFHLPHVPIYASKKWFDLYPIDTVALPEVFDDDLDDVPPIAIELSLNPTAPRHAWMTQNGQDVKAVQAYLASVSFVDAMVGMVLDSATAAGLDDNTIVVVFSDHGFHMGEKNKWAKRSLWQRTTRVPMIVAGPNIKSAKRCDEPVGLIDVYPTLVDLCRLPMPDRLDGHSLRPLIDSTITDADWPHRAVCTFGPGNHSVHSRDHHYIQYRDGSNELYDLQNDPNEHRNLAGDPAMKEVIADLRRDIPPNDAPMVPGSRGSDSPLYGESTGLQNARLQNAGKAKP